MGTNITKVVAVHGIQGTRRAWFPLAQASETMPVEFILPDLRGRGEAIRAATPEGYSLDAFATDLAEAIETEVGDEPFILAGWSMGVSVVLEYLRSPAAKRPLALMLMSGTPCIAQASWFRFEGEALLTEIAEREQRLGLKEAADHQAVAWTWRSICDTDQRDDLSQIDLPTLIIHGNEDHDCSIAHAHWLSEGIAGSRLHIIDGAGHNILIENTKTVANYVRSFFQSIKISGDDYASK